MMRTVARVVMLMFAGALLSLLTALAFATFSPLTFYETITRRTRQAPEPWLGEHGWRWISTDVFSGIGTTWNLFAGDRPGIPGDFTNGSAFVAARTGTGLPFHCIEARWHRDFLEQYEAHWRSHDERFIEYEADIRTFESSRAALTFAPQRVTILWRGLALDTIVFGAAVLAVILMWRAMRPRAPQPEASRP